MEFWIIQSLNALSFAMLLFLLCAGLSLIFGLMNILNLAHGSCYLIGAYVALSVLEWSDNFLLGLIAGAASAGVVGLVLQRFLLQRIYGRRLLQVLLTFGCMFIIGDLSIIIWGADPTTLSKPEFLSGAVNLGGIIFPKYRLFVITVGISVGIALWFFQEKTKWGAILRAGVDDEQMARAVGITALIGGVSGILHAYYYGCPNPADFSVIHSSSALLMVILGGPGALFGPLIGSLIIVFVRELVSSITDRWLVVLGLAYVF